LRRHDGLANVRLARLPCASRRAPAGANSHVPVLNSRAFPAHAEARFETAIHGLRC